MCIFNKKQFKAYKSKSDIISEKSNTTSGEKRHFSTYWRVVTFANFPPPHWSTSIKYLKVEELSPNEKRKKKIVREVRRKRKREKRERGKERERENKPFVTFD